MGSHYVRLEKGEGSGSMPMQLDRAGVHPSSTSFEVGLNVDMRSGLQPDVIAKSTGSSSQLPPLPATKPGKSTGSHGQLPRPGLRSRASIEKNLNLTGTQKEPLQPGHPLLPLWNKRTSSLPVRTDALTSDIDPDSNKGHILDLGHNVHSEPGNGKGNAGIMRSFSTPVFPIKIESFRKNGSERKGYVVLRPTSPHTGQPPRENESADGRGDINEDIGEAIPEDEAVCRICMDSLTEDYGETLKMECRCLGELALAHKECAFKWFGIKGDRVCDVCGSVVSNIPVTVVHFPIQETISHSRSMEPPTASRASVCHDVMFMGAINSVANFCFIEQLLVYKLGTKALAISISFSLIIGFLAAVTTIALVSRRYMWLYAFLQFALLCFFGYIFFYKIQLDAMPAVILAAFSSFGISMTSNALILEYVHWKHCGVGRVQTGNGTRDLRASFQIEPNGDIETGSANTRGF